MDSVVLIPFILYFIFVIVIGFLSKNFSSKGISEFFIGGRKINFFVVALSAVVSGRSAWLLIGFVGQAYLLGFSAIWAVIGYIFVELLLFLFYAPKLRSFAEKNNCITIGDFFAARFNDQNGHLRLLIVLIITIFMVSYVAAQFLAGGKAFYAYFGLNKNTGVIITAVIVLLYTMMGGFLAVSMTDVLQAILMAVMLIALPMTGIIEKGGFEIIKTELLNQNTSFFDLGSLGFGSMIAFLGIGLGSPGNPHILVRYMSIKNPHNLRWTAIIGTFWNIILAGGAFLVGIVARSYFPDVHALPNSDPENAYIALANHLWSPIMVGIILASIFAAIMSTADSQLLVAASEIVRDFIQKFSLKNKSIPENRLTFYSRLSLVILVYLSLGLGIVVKEIVFWFVLFAWAGLGAAIGPASIQALYDKKTTKAGVMAGMIGGILTVFIWKSVPALNEMIYELIPGFLAGWICTFWGSRIDHRWRNKKRKKEELR